MRRSPSVHNALVLNLRSGDANLDVRRRSPPLAISFIPVSLPLFLALRFSFATRHYHCVSSLSNLLQTCLLSYMFSLSLSSFPLSLSLSLSHSSCASSASTADGVATWLAICYSQPYAMNNCDVTPPRRKTRFPRRRRNRCLPWKRQRRRRRQRRQRDDDDADEAVPYTRELQSAAPDVCSNLNPATIDSFCVPSFFLCTKTKSELLTTASR